MHSDLDFAVRANDASNATTGNDLFNASQIDFTSVTKTKEVSQAQTAWLEEENVLPRFKLDGLSNWNGTATDSVKDATKDSTSTREIGTAERSHLTELADSKIGNPEELAKFKDNMTQFESRMLGQDQPPERQAQRQQEVAKTYEQVSRLMEASGDTPLTAEQRIRVAQQIMSNAAHPELIAQSKNSTSCAPQTVERITYSHDPSMAAKLVTNVALIGEYTASNGSNIKIDTTPHRESKIHPPADGQRGHAGELFAVTAVNLIFADQSANSDPPGQARYEQREPDKYSRTGEWRVDDGQIDTETGKPKEEPYTGLSSGEIARLSNIITGRNDKDVVLAHESLRALEQEEGRTNIEQSTRFSSEQDFNDHLARLKSEGKLPAILQIDAGNEPFVYDFRNRAIDDSSGAHVVTIQDYHPGPPPKVEIANQWGSGANHLKENAMTVHDLYLATRSPSDQENLAVIKQENAANRQSGNIDIGKEIHAAKWDYLNKDSSDEQYEKQLSEVTMQTARKSAQEDREATDGTSSGANQRSLFQLDVAMRHLPEDSRVRLVREQHGYGLIDDEQYKDKVLNLYAVMNDEIKAIEASGRQLSEKDQATMERTKREMELSANQLPADQQAEFKEIVQSIGTR